MIAHSRQYQSPVNGNIGIHRLEQRVDGETETIFIAFKDGVFVGSAVAKIMPWNACSIRASFVTPRVRRMGVASRLLAAIETWATAQTINEARSVQQLECCVLKGNEPARQFWIRKGGFIDDLGRRSPPDIIEHDKDGSPWVKIRGSDYVTMYRELR